MSSKYEKPLRDRVTSAMEDGTGNEGPLATTIAVTTGLGCCLLLFAFVMAILAVVFVLIFDLIKWLI